MDRRAFVGALGAAVSTAGCLGGGNEIVVTVRRDVSVQPGTGWVTEIPDVSDDGGAISYVSHASERYDVHFFVGEDRIEQYRTYTSETESDPAGTPSGDRDVSRTATDAGDGQYQATSADDGGRQSIDATGPYYFVLDHSDYPTGGARPEEYADPLTVHLDLTVTEQRFGLGV